MRFNVIDADELNNLNLKIVFKIIRQEFFDLLMFIINRNIGEIRTMNNFLDREVIFFFLNGLLVLKELILYVRVFKKEKENNIFKF